MMPTDIRTLLDRVYDNWRARPCFSCGKWGLCRHRELDVEYALVEAELRKARGIRPPAAVTPIRRRRA